jgi:hypothetical protein
VYQRDPNLFDVVEKKQEPGFLEEDFIDALGDCKKDDPQEKKEDDKKENDKEEIPVFGNDENFDFKHPEKN